MFLFLYESAFNLIIRILKISFESSQQICITTSLFNFISLYIQVTNAFDSPSVIRFSKDAKDSSNPFNSPAVRVNGGGTTSKITSNLTACLILLLFSLNLLIDLSLLDILLLLQD
jgi:hypothetical protein